MNTKTRPADLWFTEQLEAVAIAIAMALVLKFFVIEAYQIPSGSMQPTILGDPATGIHDRVLADKLCTMLRDPRRWEVMIFRFPLDERRLYVKRIVGLPGETLEIEGGDVWIDGRIARKPDHVNDSVLKTVFEPLDDGIDLGRAFDNGTGVILSGSSATFAADTDGTLKLRQPVKDHFLHGYDPDWGISNQPWARYPVADLELSVTATLEQGAEALRLSKIDDEGTLLFEFGAEGPDAEFRLSRVPAGGGEANALVTIATRGLPVGRPVRIVARDVDRRIVLWVDGDEWLRLDDDETGPRRAAPKLASVEIDVEGAGRVEDVLLRRDIYYLRRGPGRWEIPEDSYFGLGDNTQGSLDGRQWSTLTYTLADGRVLTGFDFPTPPGQVPRPDANPATLAGGKLRFADIHGDEFTFSRDEIVDESGDYAHFIHERYLLGKAVAVFWPVPPMGPFRWKLIR